jgi:hypothetical protein
MMPSPFKSESPAIVPANPTVPADESYRMLTEVDGVDVNGNAFGFFEIKL